jgi:hypothetical protein
VVDFWEIEIMKNCVIAGDYQIVCLEVDEICCDWVVGYSGWFVSSDVAVTVCELHNCLCRIFSCADFWLCWCCNDSVWVAAICFCWVLVVELKIFEVQPDTVWFAVDGLVGVFISWLSLFVFQHSYWCIEISGSIALVWCVNRCWLRPSVLYRWLYSLVFSSLYSCLFWRPDASWSSSWIARWHCILCWLMKSYSFIQK